MYFKSTLIGLSLLATFAVAPVVNSDIPNTQKTPQLNQDTNELAYLGWRVDRARGYGDGYYGRGYGRGFYGDGYYGRGFGRGNWGDGYYSRGYYGNNYYGGGYYGRGYGRGYYNDGYYGRGGGGLFGFGLFDGGLFCSRC